MRIIVGMSGSSGLIYGIRTLEALRQHSEVQTHLVMSHAAKLSAALETGYSQADIEALADVVYNVRDIGATLASGSFKTAGMMVTPCSMKTLSAIAHSYADNLLVRAADVVLKERRRLVLMPRETPLHTGHCRLLLAASELGAILVPPVPAMYNRPQSVDDIIDHTVGRVLDLFDIDNTLVKRWPGGGEAAAED